MPQSIVLSLTAQPLIPAHQIQGAALQQLFFHLIDIVDPELGHVLRRDKENRDYSLSALQTGLPKRRYSASVRAESFSQTQNTQTQYTQLQYLHNHPIRSKTKCWWRISFLDDELFDHLIFLWRQLKGEEFSLGDGKVTIDRITTNPLKHPWASSCSYRDIYEQADAQEHNIHLQFATPTTFKTTTQLKTLQNASLRASNTYTPLPTPEAVFQPLRKRWNRYSGLAFTPNLVKALVPTHFNIQTQSTLIPAYIEDQTVLSEADSTIAGCIGQISFRIINGGDPLITKRLNTLADFIRYCPVGSNTLLGMGITRRITDNVTSMRRSS